MSRSEFALVALFVGLFGCGRAAEAPESLLIVPESGAEAPAEAASSVTPTPLDQLFANDLPPLEPVRSDPFRDRFGPAPVVEGAEAEAALRLEGVVSRGDHLVALISGTSARVGDDVGGWTVTAIDKHSVRLRRGSRTQTLSF